MVNIIMAVALLLIGTAIIYIIIKAGIEGSKELNKKMKKNGKNKKYLVIN